MKVFKILKKIVNRIKYKTAIRLNKKAKINIKGVEILANLKWMPIDLVKSLINETYEFSEYHSIIKNIEKDDIILEAGSGIGYITMQCADIVGEKNIISFEASPSTVFFASQNFKLNKKNIDIRNAILSDKYGETYFNISKNPSSSSTVKRADSEETIKVSTVSVNDVISELKPNFLIIDIEGGEKDLIPIIDFQGVNKLSIEFHPHIIGNSAVSELIKIIINNGLDIDLTSSNGKIAFFRRPRNTKDKTSNN